MCLLWRQAKCCGESGIKAMDTNSKSDMAIKVFPKGAPCWWPGLWWSLHVWPPYIEVKWVYFSIFTQPALYCVTHNELKVYVHSAISEQVLPSRTPHIDSLFSSSLSLPSFYTSSPVCSWLYSWLVTLEVMLPGFIWWWCGNLWLHGLRGLRALDPSACRARIGLT